MKKKILFTFVSLCSIIAGKAQQLETNVATDWNKIQKSGFYSILGNAGTNSPVNTGQWFWGINAAYSKNTLDNSYYNAQIVMPINSQPAQQPGQMYIRTTDKDGLGSWAKVVTEINGTVTLNDLRFGKIGDGGVTTVPVGDISAQYNIDFSGYRDVAKDQIGARIAAIRYNNYQPDNASIQNTALVFYTNPSGNNPGTTDLVERMRISPEGNIGIGTAKPQNALDVNGTIRATEIKVETGWANETRWADFVFDKDYNLPTLAEVENHINTYNRLPDIPSEEEVKENGINLGSMQAKLLQKIEELTLYMIEQDKESKEHKKLLLEQENQIKQQAELIQALQQIVSSRN